MTKLKKITAEEFEKLGKRPRESETGKIVKHFLESDEQIMEVTNYPQKTAASCAFTYRDYIKRHGLGFLVAQRKDRIFLIKNKPEA